MFTKLQGRPHPRGITLVEVMVTTLIVAVSVTATLEVTAVYRRSSQLAEQKRIAQQAAVAKVDQLRVLVTNGVSLDGIFQLYGPLDFANIQEADEVDTTTGDIKTTGSGEKVGGGVSPGYNSSSSTIQAGSALTNFAVGEDANFNGILDPGEDLNNNNVLDFYLTRLPNSEGIRPMGTVTFIFDETPNESEFGFWHGKPRNESAADWQNRNPFGIDINGNRAYNDYCLENPPASPPYTSTQDKIRRQPYPFPIDLNGDGDTDDEEVFENFIVLPVVITIQWQGPYGPERYDHFAMITVDKF